MKAPAGSWAVADNVRLVLLSEWRQEGDLLIYRVHGNGFLHHMVRNLVGTFLEVGRGNVTEGQITAILEARCRAEAGPTAPARGPSSVRTRRRAARYSSISTR